MRSDPHRYLDLKIEFHELSTAEALRSLVERQTVFDTSEIELEETMTAFTEAIESILRQSERWQLCVTDNGSGISARDRQKIFNLFERANSSQA